MHPFFVASSAHRQHPHTTCLCLHTSQAEADFSFCSSTQTWNSFLFVWHTSTVHSLVHDRSSSRVSLLSGQLWWQRKLSLLATTSTTGATALLQIFVTPADSFSLICKGWVMDSLCQTTRSPGCPWLNHGSLVSPGSKTKESRTPWDQQWHLLASGHVCWTDWGSN